VRAAAPVFTPHLRHRFELAATGHPIEATAIRLKVSNGSLDLDEIEVNTAGEPAPVLSIAKSGSGVTISWTLGGGLEMAPTPAGPWTCVGEVSSPYTVAGPLTGSLFYRVRK
jgi:hypothetical protein